MDEAYNWFVITKVILFKQMMRFRSTPISEDQNKLTSAFPMSKG